MFERGDTIKIKKDCLGFFNNGNRLQYTTFYVYTKIFDLTGDGDINVVHNDSHLSKEITFLYYLESRAFESCRAILTERVSK